MVTPNPPSDQQLVDQLRPRAGTLYVVRWIRLDGRNIKHKYFRRPADAHDFLNKLHQGGWTAELFVSSTAWRRAPRRP